MILDKYKPILSHKHATWQTNNLGDLMEIKPILNKVVNCNNLTKEEAEFAINKITDGKLTDAQIACLLTALKMKGETIEEITAFANVMRKKTFKIKPRVKMLVDTCGTGGDFSNTFNISTTAAFVIAGAGIAVAKHGNRSVSSKCGSADVLEYLGINLNSTPKKIEKIIEKIGIGFLFAPSFHPSIKYVKNVRQDIGIRTIFNILGPLTNPANAEVQLIGVFDPNLTETLACVLKILRLKSALVVHGYGLDEITTTGKTKISELSRDRIKTYYIKPTNFGLEQAKIDEIQTKTIQENANSLLGVLKGNNGAKRNVVLLNAGATIYISGNVSSIKEGIERAKESIDSGKALEKLYLLRDFNGHS